jgi:hypothetical protein
MLCLFLSAFGCYAPAPAFELIGAGTSDVDGVYVRLEGEEAAVVYGRAYEKKTRTEHLAPPSEISMRGGNSWILKQQKFASQCFRPAADYNTSCGRCCLVNGPVIYGAKADDTLPFIMPEKWVAMGGGGEEPAPVVKHISLPPLIECLHRGTLLFSRGRPDLGEALHEQCAALVTTECISEGLTSTSHSVPEYDAHVLLSQFAQGLQLNSHAKIHAENAVQHCSGWQCVVALLESSFVLTKVGEHIRAVQSFWRAMEWGVLTFESLIVPSDANATCMDGHNTSDTQRRAYLVQCDREAKSAFEAARKGAGRKGSGEEIKSRIALIACLQSMAANPLHWPTKGED